MNLVVEDIRDRIMELEFKQDDDYITEEELEELEELYHQYNVIM